MSRWLRIAVPLGIAAVLVSVLAIGFGSASSHAAPGGNGHGRGGGNGGGKVTATITIDEGKPHYGSEIMFAVTADVKKDSDLYLLWVANKCRQGGELVYAEYQPVQDGFAGPFFLDHVLWDGGGADCQAYVWRFPSSETPLKGATLSYHADP